MEFIEDVQRKDRQELVERKEHQEKFVMPTRMKERDHNLSMTKPLGRAKCVKEKGTVRYFARRPRGDEHEGSFPVDSDFRSRLRNFLFVRRYGFSGDVVRI